jgi:hypothetical protein
MTSSSRRIATALAGIEMTLADGAGPLREGRWARRRGFPTVGGAPFLLATF